MFGRKKKINSFDQMIEIGNQLVKEIDMLKGTNEALRDRIRTLESNYEGLNMRQMTVEAKTDKYDESVNQALGLLRTLPGLGKDR